MANKTPFFFFALVSILPLSSIVETDEMHAGLGISDLNIVASLKEKETKQFEVGKVWNTGDFNMTITCTWIPTEAKQGINVTVMPQQMFLQPDEAETIFVEVHGLAIGNYAGIVSFSCNIHLPPAYTGSPVAPSGQVNAKFMILPKKSGFNFSFILITVTIVMFAIASVVIMRQKKKGMGLVGTCLIHQKP